MPPRWGYGSPARQQGLGAAQGIVYGLLVAVVFWASLAILVAR
jgi:hypothetical protein